MVVHIKEWSVEAAIGSRLKARRLANVMSLGDLAQLSTVPINVLRKAEEGQGRLSPEAVIALARAFDVRPSWFFRGLQ